VSDPHILLAGENLALGMPRRDMLPEYHRWENDPRVRQRANSRHQQFEVVELTDRQAVGVTAHGVAQGAGTQPRGDRCV